MRDVYILKIRRFGEEDTLKAYSSFELAKQYFIPDVIAFLSDYIDSDDLKMIQSELLGSGTTKWGELDTAFEDKYQIYASIETIPFAA